MDQTKNLNMVLVWFFSAGRVLVYLSGLRRFLSQTTPTTKVCTNSTSSPRESTSTIHRLVRSGQSKEAIPLVVRSREKKAVEASNETSFRVRADVPVAGTWREWTAGKRPARITREYSEHANSQNQHVRSGSAPGGVCDPEGDDSPGNGGGVVMVGEERQEEGAEDEKGCEGGWG
ncbi:hypothetical protein B0H14DRAFT_2725317 [Mycena olivaceomarginata]|nr:hypothetical protein B0H14DRAFT_2725317 [Mycena olivaceomarginata]